MRITGIPGEKSRRGLAAIKSGPAFTGCGPLLCLPIGVGVVVDVHISVLQSCDGRIYNLLSWSITIPATTGLTRTGYPPSFLGVHLLTSV